MKKIFLLLLITGLYTQSYAGWATMTHYQTSIPTGYYQTNFNVCVSAVKKFRLYYSYCDGFDCAPNNLCVGNPNYRFQVTLQKNGAYVADHTFQGSTYWTYDFFDNITVTPGAWRFKVVYQKSNLLCQWVNIETIYSNVITVGATPASPNFKLITTSGTYTAPTPPPAAVCGSSLTIDASTTTCETDYWVGIWETDVNSNRTYQYEWGKWFSGQAPNNINLQALATGSAAYWIHGPANRVGNPLFGGNLAVPPYTARYYRIEICTDDPSWTCKTMLIRVDGNCRSGEPQITQVDMPAEAETGISVFPNPAYDKINIRMLSGNPVQSYTLTDMAGRRVKTGNNPAITKNIFSIDVNDLNTGMYFLEVTDNKQQKFTSKVMVQ